MIYGFIGLGNMAGAILRGMHRSGEFADDTLCGFNRSPGKTQILQQEISLKPMESARAVAQAADVLVLGVKPQMLPEVLPGIADLVTSDKLVVTIAAGRPLAFYAEAFGEAVPVVRVMPNINARVGEAATAICPNAAATEEQTELVRRMFRSVGEVFDIPEPQFAAFTAMAGSSGAFVHLYIDALASAGVKAGLPKKLAEALACQATIGAAKLTKMSDEHPIALLDQVCSPAGSTIEGVHVLKKLGFETAVQQAAQAVIDKDAVLAGK